MTEPYPRLRARVIGEADIGSVAALLARGFRRRSRYYWEQALSRLGRHPTPAGFPKFGYLLEADGAPVGVILLIFSAFQDGGLSTVRCNVSSWYVEPDFRAYATLLISHALKKKDVTYTNISPALHVELIIRRQGFSRYSNGQFVTLPMLSRGPRDNRHQVLGFETLPNVPFEAFEKEILVSHAEYGCICFWIATADRAYPFVFLPRIVKGWIPCAQLIYCRRIADFVSFSKTIGSFLLKQARPIVIIDSNGPISGLSGRYFEGTSPKYYRGPEPPQVGDLAYTEAAMFGL